MDVNSEFLNVVAAFYPNEKKVLVVKRSDNATSYPGKWEFPGGKLEQDEKYETALSRELKEELNVSADIIQEIGSAEFDTNDLITIVMFILVDIKGEIKISDSHSEFKFVSFTELNNLDLCPADKDFIVNFEKDIKEIID